MLLRYCDSSICGTLSSFLLPTHLLLLSPAHHNYNSPASRKCVKLNEDLFRLTNPRLVPAMQEVIAQLVQFHDTLQHSGNFLGRCTSAFKTLTSIAYQKYCKTKTKSGCGSVSGGSRRKRGQSGSTATQVVDIVVVDDTGLFPRPSAARRGTNGRRRRRAGVVNKPKRKPKQMAMDTDVAWAGKLGEKEFHIAPMIDVSTIEFRYFIRLLTKRAVIWNQVSRRDQPPHVRIFSC